MESTGEKAKEESPDVTEPLLNEEPKAGPEFDAFMYENRLENWRVVELLLAGAAILFFFVFSVKSFSGYFIQTLPSYSAEVKAVVFSESDARVCAVFNRTLFAPMYVHRLFRLRFHVVLSIVIGVIVLMQFNGSIRTRYYRFHKRMGYLASLLLAVWMTNVVYSMYAAYDMLPMELFTFYFCTISQAFFCFLGAIDAIINFDSPRHRMLMMLFASSFYADVTQRVIMIGLTRMHLPEYDSYQRWVLGPLAVSCLSAYLLNLAVAGFYGYLTPALDADLDKSAESYREEKYAESLKKTL